MKTTLWIAALCLGSFAAFGQDGSKLEERFKKLDSNADGKLDKTEFAAAPANKNAKNPDRRFKRVDTNSDGSISLEEFTAAAKRAGDAAKKRDKDQ